MRRVAGAIWEPPRVSLGASPTSTISSRPPNKQSRIADPTANWNFTENGTPSRASAGLEEPVERS